ncbi:unnamed protein product [Cylindrotheca closterium]|uniref:Uncharacterized protein n=1 Tax=Cylindrotheca closterium TaxID=2856 RepID=A0AAD2FZ63_9STRA|nr:unnamed protein product [Cylindrotheca closterium]
MTEQGESSKYVIVSTRADLLITQEIACLISSEKPSSQIFIACPSPCIDEAQLWVNEIKNGSGDDDSPNARSIQVVPFDPHGDRTACRRASDELIKALGDGVVNALVMNWQGCLPGRFGVVLEESGMLEMAQIKILSQMYLIEALIEKKMLFDSSRVIVSGSEAARGIPPMFSAPILGESLDSYVSMLNGTGLDLNNGHSIYSHLQGILSLYIASLARKHSIIHFWLLSPGFTQDSLNKHIQIEENPQQFKFEDLVQYGIAQDYKVAATHFFRAMIGSPEWNYPSGILVAAAKGTRGDLCDQATLDDGKYLSDYKKQDLAFEAIHSFA